jgi:DNA-binding PadR family transcriptional regulator
MATGEALMALLLSGPRHGYDLKRAYDEWFAGMRPLAYGQVYSTLSRLQRDDLVRVAHTESGEGPERVVYELTEPGAERAREWLRDPVDPVGTPMEELIRKMLAAYRLNADPDGLMSRQRAAHLRAIKALDAGGARGGSGRPIPVTVYADHQRLHLDADLRWLELEAARFHAVPPPASTTVLDPAPQSPGDDAGTSRHGADSVPPDSGPADSGPADSEPADSEQGARA